MKRSGMRRSRQRGATVALPRSDDRFTSRQIVTIVTVIALAVVLWPVASWAGASFPQVFITDPDNHNNKAHVDGDGNLNVTGDINIANTPTVKAQQDGTWNVGITGTPTVNVGNFPSTQDVNVVGGTVTSQAPVATAFREEGFTLGSGDLEGRDIAPINASLITVRGVGDDELLITFSFGGATVFGIGDFDESLGPVITIPLTQPIPIDHLFLQCENESDDCGLLFIDIVGN